MIFHQCKPNVIEIVFVSSTVVFTSGFNMNQDGIIPSAQATVSVLNKKDISKSSLCCSACGEIDIPIKDLRTRCQQCGNVIKLEDARINSAGVICCAEHMEKYFPDKRAFSLVNAIVKSTTSK